MKKLNLCPKTNTPRSLEKLAEVQSLTQNEPRHESTERKEDAQGRKWKPIEGWEKYSISDDGIVSRSGKTRKTYINHDGYHAFGVKDKGRHAILLLHREIAKAFIPRSEGNQVLHKNDIKTDNSIENLRWGTHAQNMKDRDFNNRTARGEKQFKAKLNDSQILKIRASSLSQRQLARFYRVSKHTIHRVKTFKGWAHV